MHLLLLFALAQAALAADGGELQKKVNAALQAGQKSFNIAADNYIFNKVDFVLRGAANFTLTGAPGTVFTFYPTSVHSLLSRVDADAVTASLWQTAPMWQCGRL